ncbi:hypothetical protein AAC387_Pa01g0637 [Persea americana]
MSPPSLPFPLLLSLSLSLPPPFVPLPLLPVSPSVSPLIATALRQLPSLPLLLPVPVPLSLSLSLPPSLCPSPTSTVLPKGTLVDGLGVGVGVGVGECRKKLKRDRLLINVIFGNFKEEISGHSKKEIGMRSFVRGIRALFFNLAWKTYCPFLNLFEVFAPIPRYHRMSSYHHVFFHETFKTLADFPHFLAAHFHSAAFLVVSTSHCSLSIPRFPSRMSRCSHISRLNHPTS